MAHIHYPSEAQVRALAYELWVCRGRPAGDAEVDWFNAQAQLTAELALRAACENLHPPVSRLRRPTSYHPSAK